MPGLQCTTYVDTFFCSLPLQVLHLDSEGLVKQDVTQRTLKTSTWKEHQGTGCIDPETGKWNFNVWKRNYRRCLLLLMCCFPRMKQYSFTLAFKTESRVNRYLSTVSPQKLRECITGLLKTKTATKVQQTKCRKALESWRLSKINQSAGVTTGHDKK